LKTWPGRPRPRPALVDALGRPLRAALSRVGRRPCRDPLRPPVGHGARVRRPSRAPLRRARVRPDARRLHRALAAGAHPRAGRPVPGVAPRDIGPRRGPGRARRLVLRLPERVADGGAVARPGHPRPSGGAARSRHHGRACLPGRVRLRPSRDPVGPRRRGRRAVARARDPLCEDRDAERSAGDGRDARGHRAPRARRGRVVRGRA